MLACWASGTVSSSGAGAAFFAAAGFLAGAFFVLAFTVERGLDAAATLRGSDSAAESTTVTPSSLRRRSSVLRCLPVMPAASLASRTASELTSPVALPSSTRPSTSGWDRTSAGSLRDVLVDTNYLS